MEQKSETCCVKSKPGNMPCNEEVEYRNASEDGAVYSGWHHKRVGAVFTHNAVPKSWI